MPDGVFTVDNDSEEHRPRFVTVDAPSDEEIASIIDKAIRRTATVMERYLEGCEDEELGDALARVQALSIKMRLWGDDASGPDGGTQSHRLSKCSAFVEGVSLHAAVAIHQNDRDGVEALCRYGLRTAIALDRISWTDDGQVRYRYKRSAPSGAMEFVCEPVEFLTKLVALLPPPRKHLTRYHGVFAPSHAWRSRIVPVIPDANALGRDSSLSLADEQGEVASSIASEMGSKDEAEAGSTMPEPASVLTRRLDWATLVMRVFDIDVLECPKCQERMRVLAYMTEQDVIERILTHLDLPTTSPESPRSPPPS